MRCFFQKFFEFYFILYEIYYIFFALVLFVYSVGIQIIFSDKNNFEKQNWIQENLNVASFLELCSDTSRYVLFQTICKNIWKSHISYNFVIPKCANSPNIQKVGKSCLVQGLRAHKRKENTQRKVKAHFTYSKREIESTPQRNRRTKQTKQRDRTN